MDEADFTWMGPDEDSVEGITIMSWRSENRYVHGATKT
jgi:hypothetical protein